MPPRQYTDDMPLSLDNLESHLFECADIIRDAVDPTDYKEYILPLVYYKSVSDEFEKRYTENVEKYGGEFARKTTSTTSLLSPKATYGTISGRSATT